MTPRANKGIDCLLGATRLVVNRNRLEGGYLGLRHSFARVLRHPDFLPVSKIEQGKVPVTKPGAIAAADQRLQPAPASFRRCRSSPSTMEAASPCRRSRSRQLRSFPARSTSSMRLTNANRILTKESLLGHSRCCLFDAVLNRSIRRRRHSRIQGRG
jgi:hypothetical protein